MSDLKHHLAAGADVAGNRPMVLKLAAYYDHLGELARGYVKDAAQREAQLRLIAGWKAEAEHLAAAI